MNNLPDNLHFGLPYADFSQAQNLHNAVLNSPQMQQHPSSIHTSHLQDSHFSGLSSPYQSFPILQSAAAMQPPQLHQPTVDVTKDVKTKHRPKPRPPVETLPEPTRVTRPPNAFLLFNKEMRKQLKDQNPTMKVAEISKEIGGRWKCLNQVDKDRYVAEAERLKDHQRALNPNAMYIRRSKAELVKAGHYTRPKMKNRQTGFVDQSTGINNGNNNTNTNHNHNHNHNHNLINNNAPNNNNNTNNNNNNHHHHNPGNYLPEQSSAAPMPRSTRSPRKRQRRDKNSSTPKHPLSAYMWYLTEVRPDTMRAYPGSTVGQISKLCADRWNTMSETEQMPWKTKAHADKERYAREMQVYAAQVDHPMGRGTRQKYRSAAAASAAAAAAAAGNGGGGNGNGGNVGVNVGMGMGVGMGNPSGNPQKQTNGMTGVSNVMGMVDNNSDMANLVGPNGNIRNNNSLNSSMNGNPSNMTNVTMQSSLQSTLQSTLHSRYDTGAVLCGGLPRMHLNSNILEDTDQYVNTE